MDNEAAAKELGISIRSLQRATKAGKLAVAYKRGKSGKMEAVYDEKEIARYKRELNEVVIPPHTEPTSLALTTRDRQASEFVTLLAEAIKNAINARVEEATKRLHQVEIHKQLFLSLAEAAEYSGLSKNFLTQAIHAKKLKAKIMGRGYRIKRTDLEDYVKKL